MLVCKYNDSAKFCNAEDAVHSIKLLLKIYQLSAFIFKGRNHRKISINEGSYNFMYNYNIEVFKLCLS
jgi:hypothetical protein